MILYEFQCFANFKAKTNQIVSRNISFEREGKRTASDNCMKASKLHSLHRKTFPFEKLSKISIFKHLFSKRLLNILAPLYLFMIQKKFQLHALVENLTLYKMIHLSSFELKSIDSIIWKKRY